jgi:hypothetical protein
LSTASSSRESAARGIATHVVRQRAAVVDERLASRVLDNQHRSPALAHELHRPQRPRSSEIVLKFVFADEAIDALERRMRSAGKDGYEGVLTALTARG